MGDGTKDNPFISADIYMRIAANGNITEKLDLSGYYFKEGIDLIELDLTGAILNRAILKGAVLKRAGLDKCHLKGALLTMAHLEQAYLTEAQLGEAKLWGAHLEEASLRDAHLEEADLSGAHLEGTKLWDAHLEKVNLRGAHLEGADLRGAYLEGAHLEGVELSRDTRLENVHWGNYILGEETDRIFVAAEDSYRRLKQWYTNAGIFDVSAEFFFREMEAKRRGLRWRPKPQHRLWLNIYAFISGHGERPLRVIRWAAIWIFGSAAIYYLIGGAGSLSAVWDSLYFSMVSFTALGYGSWVHTTSEWMKGIGALESFMGVFTLALFLVTFTRKIRR